MQRSIQKEEQMINTTKSSNNQAVMPPLTRFYTVEHPKKSPMMTFWVYLYLLYALVPFVWLFINATKTKADFASTFGLSFGSSFALWDNIVEVFTYNNGIFARWILNTVLYTIIGTIISVLFATMGGYALAKLNFKGKHFILLTILGSMAIPGVLLVVPQFLIFSQLGLTNTPWAVIIPSLLNPFGLYLMWTFSGQSVPTSLIEAARIDGAGEGRIFFQVALPLMKPSLVTVSLFAFVSIWYNYFLPLIMLKDSKWYPLALGLAQWNAQGNEGGNMPIIPNLVITASLLVVFPLILLFLALQRYWQSGLAIGATKG